MAGSPPAVFLEVRASLLTPPAGQAGGRLQEGGRQRKEPPPPPPLAFRSNQSRGNFCEERYPSKEEKAAFRALVNSFASSNWNHVGGRGGTSRMRNWEGQEGGEGGGEEEALPF